jgi:hypothetical protein
MNVWERGGVSLIRLDELARAAALSGERVERCAYVLRAILDSARRLDRDGAFEIDAYDVAFTLSCAPQSIVRAAQALVRREVGLIDPDKVASPASGCIAGAVARWRDWAVERTLSTIV